MVSPPSALSPHTHLESLAASYAHPGKIRRIKCPVHGGTDRNVSLGNGWAKCHSQGCSSKDILAALGERPALRYTPPPMPPRPAVSIAPLPPVSHTAASDYLAGIRTPEGAEVRYQRYDGQTGKHWRNLDKRRNPGVTGDGWQARRFDPLDPATAVAIALAEGEKDAAILATSGLIAFCAPRGATSLKAADFTELVYLAKETGLPVILAGDNDDVGRLAMRRVWDLLRGQGVTPLDTAGHAPLKGSIADLPADELDALIRLQLMELDVRMVKPIRSRKKYKEYWCLRPIRWQGLGGDGQMQTKLRPCGNTSACERCAAWEAFLHIERAWRGRPAQLVEVSGFGDADSRIPETVGEAKVYREQLEDRLRKSSAVRPYSQNTTTSERRNFLTALRIGDDYRAGVAMFLSQPLTAKELARERKRAELAGLTFTVTDNPSRAAIEAVSPRSLTVAMEGVGNTDKTNTWTSSGWPAWVELEKTYQCADGRDLEDGEEFDPDAIEARAWRQEHRQTWDRTATLRANMIWREDHAFHNATLWVSRCVGLNLETLRAIGRATSTSEIAALIEEVGDYDGPTSLLRDAAQYLAGELPWRKAFRPVLTVAGWRA